MDKYIIQLTTRKPGFWNGMKCMFGNDSRFSEFKCNGEGSLDELHEQLQEKVLEIQRKNDDNPENKSKTFDLDLTKPQYNSSGMMSEAGDEVSSRLIEDKTQDISKGFNLSERILWIDRITNNGSIEVKDVKIFINKLKNNLIGLFDVYDIKVVNDGNELKVRDHEKRRMIIDEIDKLIGGKLK